jgi:hypothetical protein
LQLGLWCVPILRLLLTAAGSIAALNLRPRVQLARENIEVSATTEELIETFRERFAESPDEILAIERDRLVRRFSGAEGPFKFNTVEVVRYEPTAITFEHLAGPFAECLERFEFTAMPSGSRLTHTGSYRLRGGLWTAALAFGPVKKAFESHVRGHFENLADEFATANAL